MTERFFPVSSIISSSTNILAPRRVLRHNSAVHNSAPGLKRGKTEICEGENLPHINSRIPGVMATAFLLAASVGSASAGQILNFSYTDREGDTFAGTLNGNLQSDNNTFLATSIGSLTLGVCPSIQNSHA